MGAGRAAERGSSSGSAKRTDLLSAAYAWQEPQVVEEPDFDPSIDAPFLEGLICVPCGLCGVSCVWSSVVGCVQSG